MLLDQIFRYKYSSSEPGVSCDVCVGVCIGVGVCVCVCACTRAHSLGQLFLGVCTQLQQAHEHGRHVHVRLPHRKAPANQIDSCAADGAVGGEFGARGLEEEERQRLT